MMGGEEEEKEREPNNNYMYLYIGRRKKGVRFWKQRCATTQGSTARRSWSMHLQVQYCFHGREKRFWTQSIKHERIPASRQDTSGRFFDSLRPLSDLAERSKDPSGRLCRCPRCLGEGRGSALDAANENSRERLAEQSNDQVTSAWVSPN
jgi:hypothetical protein